MRSIALGVTEPSLRETIRGREGSSRAGANNAASRPSDSGVLQLVPEQGENTTPFGIETIFGSLLPPDRLGRTGLSKARREVIEPAESWSAARVR